MRLTTYIIVVLTTQVDRVHVHAAIVGPVVSERDEELDANLRGGIYHLVEGLDVDGRGPIGEPLENNIRVAGPFASVFGQPIWVIRNILVIESPGAKNFQTGLLRGSEPKFDVRLVLTKMLGANNITVVRKLQVLTLLKGK